MPDQAYEGTHATVVSKGSAFRRYQDVVIGSRSLWTTLYYEWSVTVGALPGALGMLMRKIFWPGLFQSCGKGTVFGSNVIVRHPGRIRLGSRIVVGDGCLIDARSGEASCAISIGDDTIFSNNVLLSCKGGTMTVGSDVGLGAQSMIHAVNGAAVRIGNGTRIGPMCYLAGGGNYRMDQPGVPPVRQGLQPGGDIEVGDDVWLGAHVTILPGAGIGDASVASAGAVLNRAVPEHVLCGGVPAKTIRRLDEPESEK